LRDHGVDVRAADSFADALVDLHASGVTHLLIEPGPTLARGLFNEIRLIDRLWLFQSPKALGPTGVAAAAVPDAFAVIGQTQLGDDRLTEYLNTASDAFFTAESSADFALVAAGATIG
jgi:riboflavin biosynthesis pyrimidine reductase